MWTIRNANKRRRYKDKRYSRLRNAKAKMERLGVKQCKVCKTDKNLTIDHIIPISKGGKSNIENLQILCAKCNQLKANIIN
jgi:5-methylcytosine-specific restriction endonuclease McrA